MTTNQKERRTLLVTPAPDTDPTVGRWLWLLNDTRDLTLEALKGLTDAVVNWMPPDGGHNIGTLLYHVVLIELDWLYVEILEQPDYETADNTDVRTLLPYPDRDEHGRLTVVKHETVQDHLTRLTAGRQLLTAALHDMHVDDFYRPRHLTAYDVTPEWVLHHLIQHEAEHRGEISEIRRRAAL